MSSEDTLKSTIKHLSRTIRDEIDANILENLLKPKIQYPKSGIFRKITKIRKKS